MPHGPGWRSSEHHPSAAGFDFQASNQVNTRHSESSWFAFPNVLLARTKTFLAAGRSFTTVLLPTAEVNRLRSLLDQVLPLLRRPEDTYCGGVYRVGPPLGMA